MRCNKAVVDAYSESVQIDVSQTQHFCGVGSFDEANDLEMRGYVARCAEDEAAVHHTRDRARQLKAERPTGHMKNQALGLQGRTASPDRR